MPTAAVEAGERRGSPRQSIAGAVEITSDDPPVHVVGTVVNISLTGCKVRLDADLPLESPLDLRFSLAGAEFQIRGTVRRKAGDSAVGVEFLPDGSQAK